MVHQVKLLLAMLLSRIRGLAAPLVNQLPDNMPGKAANDNTKAYVPAMYMDNLNGVPGSDFALVHTLLWQSFRRVNQWIEVLFLSLPSLPISFSHSSVQIK